MNRPNLTYFNKFKFHFDKNKDKLSRITELI